MIYFIKPNETVKIKETGGTIQNVDSVGWVEISNSENFTSSVILHCHKHCCFRNLQLWARLYDNSCPTVELRVLPIILDGGGSGDSGGGDVEPDNSRVSTDAEFENMLDDVFGGTATTDGEDPNFAQSIDDILNNNVDGTSTGGEGGTVTIDGTTHNVISDEDFQKMLDDIGL